MSSSPASPIKIGVSACLLGEKVRYDGGHKLDRFITETLGRFFRFIPCCPEVGCGLPVPREAMRLELVEGSLRLVTIATRVDHTERMLAWCAKRIAELEREDICGFIFKKNSPSSGLYNVTVYREGMAKTVGQGLFANAVTEHFPNLPVEEEGRFHEREFREHFIERVFAYRRWKDLA